MLSLQRPRLSPSTQASSASHGLHSLLLLVLQAAAELEHLGIMRPSRRKKGQNVQVNRCMRWLWRMSLLALLVLQTYSRRNGVQHRTCLIVKVKQDWPLHKNMPVGCPLSLIEQEPATLTWAHRASESTGFEFTCTQNHMRDASWECTHTCARSSSSCKLSSTQLPYCTSKRHVVYVTLLPLPICSACSTRQKQHQLSLVLKRLSSLEEGLAKQ